MKRNIGWMGIALFLGSGLCGYGNDAGDLVYPGDYPHKARAELYYENIQRDIRITSESPTLTQDWDADVYALRLQTEVGPGTRMDFDIGAIGANGGSEQLMGGIGLRYLAFDEGPWRGGAFGQVRYAPDLKGRVDLRGRPDTEVKYDLVEADAGVLVSYRLRVADQFTMAPYAGPVLSIVRLSGDTVKQEGAKTRFKAEEDQVLGAVLGVGLEFQDGNSLRFETRYLGDFSVSVAAAIVF